MASISFRGNRWQVRVRRKGHATETRSFVAKQDAEKWARAVETGIDQGAFVSTTEAQHTTLKELIERYVREVTPTMKGAHDDTIRLLAMARRPIARLPLANLLPVRIAEFRDERLHQVGAGTVIRELAYLSAIINHARREWGIHIHNPVASVRKPTSPRGRNRVLLAEEQVRLLEALEPIGRRNPWVAPIVVLALESAMRRGELLALRWEHIDLYSRTALLPDTKNGEPRTVPLSSVAIEILTKLPRAINGVVFPVQSFTVDAAFKRAIKRAGLQDLRFHDLRHTAITRMAEKLPNVIELAAVSGHKSLAMLKRYYHPRAEDLARKLG